MPAPARALVLSALALLVLSACSGAEEVTEASIMEGRYAVAFGAGYDAQDEAKILAITAQIDRSAGDVTFTLADGTTRKLRFEPRSKDQWVEDCATMNGHALDEIADLTPAPLVLESMSFATPVLYAKCGPSRIILANGHGEDDFLAFDLVRED